MLPIIVAFAFGAMPTVGPLSAANPSVDRGEVRSGPQITQEFALTHRGESGTLTITGIKVGCGCLNPAVAHKVLQPGESTKLTLTVNTLTQPPGPNVWHAVVHYRIATTGDDTTPPAVQPDRELELKVLARLIQEISVTPPMLAISTSGETTQTVTVTDRRATPLTVRAASTTNPYLSATVQPATDTSPRTQTVSVTVKADFSPGQSDETLLLVTSDPTCPELRVPIRVTKRNPGAVIVSPTTAEIRFARGQEEASRLVQLRKPGGGQLRVERVDSTNPAVRAKWPDSAGPVATVRVIVDRVKASSRSGQAEVQVRLAEPAGEVIVLPVSWTVPE